MENGIEVVYFPLGMERRKVCNYRAIKPSAFIFKTPKHAPSILKQIEWFERQNGCGLELLALRRTFGERRNGSLVDIATILYQAIQSDSHDIVKPLNLKRLSLGLVEVSQARLADLHACETRRNGASLTGSTPRSFRQKSPLQGVSSAKTP